MSQNKIVSIVGLIIAAIYGFAVVNAPSAGATFLSGTKVFPIIITILTFVFSILVFLQDYKKEVEVKKFSVNKKVLKTMGICVFIFVIYTLIFEAAGYIFSTIIMLFTLLCVINKGSLKTNIIVSLVFSFVAYGIFAKLLAISLPPGIINF